MPKFLLLLCMLLVTKAYSQDISSSDLKIGTRYWSPSRNYFVEFQSDGNLVVYTSSEQPVWNTKTNGTSAKACVMQGDGNLVLYDGNTPIWNSETSGHSGVKSVLQMQDDGNLVINACINCFWTPLWSWKTGKWTTEQINDFPKSHPNGAKCCAPPTPPVTKPSQTTGIINPRYTVDKSRSDWVVKFQTKARIRFHADSGFSPGVVMDRNVGDELIIKPGQWAEDWFYINGNYVWSLMSDADHR